MSDINEEPKYYMPYNKSLLDYARSNRKQQTPAEGLLRNLILKYKPLGYKFTRQKPLGPFIADFYCSKLLLIIEVDGSSHDDKQEYDAQRTSYLEDQRIIVIRYTNNDVMKNIEGVKIDLEHKIREREKNFK